MQFEPNDEELRMIGMFLNATRPFFIDQDVDDEVEPFTTPPPTSSPPTTTSTSQTTTSLPSKPTWPSRPVTWPINVPTKRPPSEGVYFCMCTHMYVCVCVWFKLVVTHFNLTMIAGFYPNAQGNVDRIKRNTATQSETGE